MEHKFPLGSFHRENGTTFSGIPFFPEIFHWDEPKNHVPFTTQPEFPEFFGKWKTPIVSLASFDDLESLSQNDSISCLAARSSQAGGHL